jgi:hypothetical protein
MNLNHNISLVTGIWDLGRDSAASGWNRSFDHYINNFIKLLTELKDFNLLIFIDPSLEELVWKHRDKSNTRVYRHSKDQFEGNFFPFFDKIQKIRNDPNWYNQAAWLKDSTQGSLEYYNPMVMSKMFLLHNAKLFNPFSTDYLYWIDGGISNTVSLGYFNHSPVINNILRLSKELLFICFPYETQSEIHGFDIKAMRKYAKDDSVNRVARGGFFGGHKDAISEANNLYYHLLNSSLSEGYMGTEESIFTIMTYLDPDKYNYRMINGDGLIYKFFEDLKEENAIPIKEDKVNLYINTFNSPDQLILLLESFTKHEPQLLDSTNKILINNTVKNIDNLPIFKKYDEICNQYNMEHIQVGNMGICGSRQWAADHFNNSDSNFMLFFEDDMLLDFDGKCRFGFNKFVPDLYNSVIKIMKKEKYDFLKLSFTEFYGHNGDQWSWHNVPQKLRLEYFGDIQEKPSTKFNNIKHLKDIPYADGEIYYSNWPHIISREGNRKCFIDTKWAHPYEQTWMSHIYILTRQGVVKPAILLASPITHNRVHHYAKNERKEN